MIVLKQKHFKKVDVFIYNIWYRFLFYRKCVNENNKQLFGIGIEININPYNNFYNKTCRMIRICTSILQKKIVEVYKLDYNLFIE